MLESREVPNAAPVFAPTGARFIAPGYQFYAQQFATDADGDWMTYSATNLPQGLGIDPSTGVVTGTVPNGQYAANHTITSTFTVVDGKGGAANQQVTYTITNAPNVWVVNTTDDTNLALPAVNAKDANNNVSLRSAIQQANLDRQTSVLPTYITFDATVFANVATISLNSPMDIVTADVTITGPGRDKLFIDGGGNKRLFQIGTLIQLPNNPLPTVAAVFSNLTMQHAANLSEGGAIQNNWNTFLISSRIKESAAGRGGAAHNTFSLTVINSDLFNNTANVLAMGSGGAIDTEGVNGHVTLIGSTLKDNTAVSRGGGISLRSNGQAFLFSTSLIHNVSNGGGGVYNSGGWFQMSGGLMKDNEATNGGDGGGLLNEGGAFLTSVVFDSNKAAGRGGGVDAKAQTCILTNCSFVGNNQAANGAKASRQAGAVLLIPGCVGITEAEIYGY